MAKRIISTPPQLTRLQRLTSDEDSLICNYRLLWGSGKKLISDAVSKTVVQTTEAESGNVTGLRGTFNGPDDGTGEPTTSQRLTRREADLIYAYRVMDPETKEMTDFMYAGYLSGEVQRGEEPRSENVVSIRR